MIRALSKDGLKIAVCISMIAAFLFLVGASVFLDLKNSDVVILLIGQVSGIMGTIAAYYYGTSKSSETKSQTIAEMKMKE